MLLYALPLSIFPPSFHATDMAPRPKHDRVAKKNVTYDESDSDSDIVPILSSSDPLSLPLPTPSHSLPVFNTPARLRSRNAQVVASENLQRTPGSHGAGSMAAYDEGLIREDAKYYRDNFKTYIAEDLKTNRVLVGEDDFLDVVYNISPKERQSPAHEALIATLGASTKFDKAWRTYLKCCATVRVGSRRQERQLYRPRVDVYNAAFDFLDNHGSKKLDDSERIRFYVNDPARLMHGVYAKGLSVDLGQVSTCIFEEGESVIKDPKEATLGAAMLLGAEEMKAQPGCLASVKEFKYKALSKDGRDPAEGVLNDDSDDPFVSDGEPGPDSDEDLPATSQQISGRKRKIGPGSYASANKVIRTATRSLGECKELVSTD
ncbi:hypothetical protein BDZ89DRAFT_1167033 [Hymenopellis radicata]|nr:hypothetical protein BDZ89DRAFT_1167033 [Hymenopellis radicata]